METKLSKYWLIRPARVKNRLFWIHLILLFAAPALKGQFYETSQPPASLRWKELITPDIRLIFPESFSPRAFELAGLLEEARELTWYSLNHKPASVPVIVHNHNSRSNGLVVWAPRRMELYPASPQFIRGGHWLTQLAVHEQRHVVQIDKLDQGPVRLLSFLLGEQAVGLSAGRIPEWFYEGDAIVAETALTSAGRGRTPSFYMPMRALLLSDPESFSYDKYLHGSFRDYVPDSYQYGYQMVSALRKQYGPGIWGKAIDFTAMRPYYLAPFYSALRNTTGSGMSSLHQNVVSDLRDEWLSLHEIHDHIEYNKINNRPGDIYLNYRYPVWLGDTAVIALKSGIGHVNELVKLDTEGNEKHVFYPAPFSSPVIAVSGSRIAWTEFQSDLRWGQRNFSVIRVMDIKTGRHRQITSRSRYFSPSFGGGGLFLAVVETGHNNTGHIVLLNSVTGEVASRFTAPEGKNLQRPVFSSDDEYIMVTAVCREGTSILSVNRETGTWTTLREPSYVNISGVFPCGEMVCFHSDFTGIDNIFAIYPDEGSHYQVTSSSFGAFDANLTGCGNHLVWSDYTVNGFDLARTEFDPAITVVPEEKEHFRDHLVQALVEQEKGIVKTSEYDTSGWEIRPYRRGLNLLRFHSWSPFYYDYSELNPDRLPVFPGFTLLSQNLLNTANTYLGYSYRNGNHVAHGRFIYKGWYPVFETGFDYGDEPQILTGRDTIGPESPGTSGRLNLSGTVYLPLNLSAGRYIAGLTPLVRISYDNLLYHYENDDIYKRGMTTIRTRLIAYRHARRSLRDLAPRWGQTLRLQRNDAPFDSENLGSISAAGLTLYFPGIFPHNSLRIEGELQRQEQVKYYYANLIRLPRGYSQEASEDLRLLKGSYSFPFLYPDISIPLPGVIYLKRFHAELFAEGGVNGNRVPGNGTLEWENERLFSWGAVVTSALHILRAPVPINLSAGLARIPSRNEMSFLFSLEVDLGAL